MYNTSVAATPKAFDLTPSAFPPVVFLAGTAGASQTSTPSLFLMDGAYARLGMVGFFFIGNTVIGILVSQFLTGRSDRKGDRKDLIVFCCVLGMLACVLLAWDRSYFILLFVGVLLSSSGSTASPQMFAPAREYAGRTGWEAVMFSSVLRMQVSLAWVIGLPLACASAMGFSFTVTCLSAAVVFVVCGVMVQLFLLSMSKSMPLATGAAEAPRHNRRDALLLFVICILMWGTNSLHIINMPPSIINELHLPEKLADIMVDIAAGLEIPTMLVAGYFAKHLGKRLLMRITVVTEFFFYVGMLLAHSSAILFGLQLPNAIYIGILGGTGTLYLQDLMPGQAGSATTLCTNTVRVGWIIVGSLAGVAVEIWNCHTVFWFALVMIAATVACPICIKDV